MLKPILRGFGCVYDYDEMTVNEVVATRGGNYALGYIDRNDGSFVVQYVGRAKNLNDRLKDTDHLYHKPSYKQFSFRYEDDERRRYATECRNYHDFGENDHLDNKIHPAKPDESGRFFCPVCGQ